MELFKKYFNVRIWRTLQAICACPQIFNWFTYRADYMESKNSTQLLIKYKHYQVSNGALASLHET